MSQFQTPDTAPESAVAIIGMSGRFPGASDVDQLWENLVGGVKSITRFDDDELLAAGVDQELLRKPNYVKAGAVVEDVEQFDAAFFGYTPREAETMDPQHRLFLECAWEALEDAAYSAEAYDGLVGVFGGSGFCTYLLNNILSNPEMLDLVGKLQLAVGNDRDSLASTVSYKLNLKGPSVAVQTFCSTSLVATHLACQSLLNFECDVALAGGAAITTPQRSGYLYEAGGIVSPDGECRTFDAEAQGSIMSNGVAVVALKRLDEALAEGDHIYAVIRGSATNNDGIVRAGFTAPGLDGQAEVIAEALAHAGVDPETIGYIEAHGTATMLGDSVELAAMIKAFGARTSKQRFCAIGSVKPNIGHLDRASGVTGLIKASLALKNGLIPPSLNFHRAAPEVDLEHSPFYVNTAATQWKRSAHPRRAGVSSFGLGGTNAHMVLEETPEIEASDRSRPWQLMLLSAKTQSALESATRRLADFLRHNPTVEPADVAYTLQVGRAAFNYRRAVVCRDTADAVAVLEASDSQRVLSAQQTGRDRPVNLVFSASGDGLVRQLAALYRQEATVREHVDSCCEQLSRRLGVDVRARLLDAHAAPNDEACAFVAQYALAQLLQHWGVRPGAVGGYGVGALVAAAVSGVLALDDASKLLVERVQSGTTATQQHLAALIGSVELRSPEIPILGSAGQVTPEQARSAAFWADRLQAGAGAETLLAQDADAVVLLIGSEPQRGEHSERLIVALDPADEDVGLQPALGRLWLAGASIAWPKVWAEQRRRRLSLPTYPFERQRYWIEAGAAPGHAVPQPAAGKRADIADWFYTPLWKQAPAPPRLDAAGIASHGPWLVFDDGGSLAAGLLERLRASGASVTAVRSGSAFMHRPDGSLTIDPQSAADYVRLLEALDVPPRAILHLWSLDDDRPAMVETEQFIAAQDSGFYSLLLLAKAIGKQHISEPVDLLLLTPPANSVTGAEQLSPEYATLAGACRVIPQEHLNLTCRHVDLDLPPAGSWQERKLIDQLLGELESGAPELPVAYRRSRRWIRVYEPARLDAGGDAISLRERGVYLITGGLGGVGLILAEHLARTRRARLILTGRSAFPARESWDAWLDEHEQGDAVSARIRSVRQLEALGAEVQLATVDVADAGQMRALLARVVARWGELNGVIHAAGISEERAFGVVQQIDRGACEAHFRPKAHGLYALERALDGVELDFCLLMSSLSSVLGGLGFVAYAAANTFMDSFAERHNAVDPVPWISVNWDTWHTREGQHDVVGQLVAAFEMSPAEGSAAFERILEHGATRIVNSTGDLEARFDQWVRMAGVRDEALHGAPPAAHARPDLPTPYVAPSSEIEQRIADVWQAVLGVELVGVNDNFLDLGGHSLLGTQLFSHLRQAFRVNLPLSVLFEAPTVAQLAVAIEIALIDELEQIDEQAASSLA